MRFYTQQHKHYCGIDLHARSLYLCILNQAGEKLVHRKLNCDRDELWRPSLDGPSTTCCSGVSPSTCRNLFLGKGGERVSQPSNSSHQGRTIGGLQLRHAHAPQSASMIHGKGPAAHGCDWTPAPAPLYLRITKGQE